MSMIEPEPAPSTGNFLTQKYGPLPGWGWLAITVLVVYVVLRMRSKKQSSTTGTTTGGTTSNTGTNAALSSNLVAFQEPVPTLNGTYQVQVTPENAPNSIYATTQNSSTQGLASVKPGERDWLQAGGAPAPSPAVNVQPQTQSSSPQTQSNVG